MTAKQRESLYKKLSKHGEVQTLKAGLVFTVFMTGKGLSGAKKVMEITSLLHEASDHYKQIEVMKNDDNFLLLILKPI